MPFVLDYTNPDTGANHPESFWVLAYSSISHVGRTALFIFHGYVDQASRDSGMNPFDAKLFNYNDPTMFDAHIAAMVEGVSLDVFEGNAQTLVLDMDSFFNTAVQFSVIKVLTAAAFKNEVVIGLSQVPILEPPGDWPDGVTIKVNGSSVSIDSTSEDSGQLAHFLTNPVLPGDTVTWEYDATPGHILDGLGLPMPSVAPVSVVNNTVPILGACSIPAQSGMSVAGRLTLAGAAAITGVSGVSASATVTP